MKSNSADERLEFFNYSNVTVEHLHRYAVANEFINNKKVLDIACGEGYGSYLLSKKAKSVIGVDIDKDTIEKAIKKYKEINLNFLEGSVEKIPVENNSIDIVVSFETIEHHGEHEKMLEEIKRVLKFDGILIMSSPDKLHYSDKPNYKNKFHIKELYFEEFKSLIKMNFKNSFFYFQKSYNFNSYISNVLFFENLTIYSGDNTKISKNLNEQLYNLAIASNNDYLEEIQPSIFNGKNIRNLFFKKLMNNNVALIKRSKSYRLGNFLINPFIYFKKILNLF